MVPITIVLLLVRRCHLLIRLQLQGLLLVLGKTPVLLPRLQLILPVQTGGKIPIEGRLKSSLDPALDRSL